MKNTKLYWLLLPCIVLLASCKEKFAPDDYTAYFSGEIINPNTNYILFCKDDKILDTLFLNENNHFSHKFDSLSPGMYIYRSEPEYQYVYFEKNDSLTLRLNARDFDHSIIFSGRGAEKNNFLMNLTVKNLVDESARYENYEQPVDVFIKKTDSIHAARTTYYLRNKAYANWSPEFDLYAKTKLDLHFYAQKEMYPLAHYIRTGEDIRKQLAKDYYDFRKKVNFNNEKLISYSSYTRYLSIMLNSISNESEMEFNQDSKFDNNIIKLNVVDTLITNSRLKNTVLNNIALIYLLEDQNIAKNDLFLDRYFELSTDENKHEEVKQIQQSVQTLKSEKRLPDVPLVNTKEETVHINSLITKPTLLFVWTKYGLAHANGAHLKALSLLNDNKDIQIISVCIDGDQKDWLEFTKKYENPNLLALRSDNFKELKDKWVITKIQRSMILNQDGTIKNPFVNIFDKDIAQRIISN